MGITFERPYALLLIPAAFAIVIFISTKLRMQNRAKKNKYIAFRCIVIMLMILVLSGISINRRQDETTTIFLVDVSDSVSASTDEVQQYLQRVILTMPDKNRMGVVVFGKTTEIEQFITDKQLFTAFGTHPVTTSTNIENAITTALSMYSDDSAKRLVLITDGKENEGSMLNMATSLQSQNVELCVLQLEQETTNEVYVDNLTVPDTIRMGDQYAITVTVVSNVETDASISLYAGRTLKAEEAVRLSVGENQFVFYDTADENGFLNYRVQVSADEDTMTVNNEYSAYAQIESKAKVLVVEGTDEEAASLSKVFDAAGIYYSVVTPAGVPTSINQMMEYKSIVLLNVYYDDLKEGFLNNIKSYVKDYAGGLICIGGDSSYALGGYRDTVLEEILPVNMDLEGERQIPKMEIELVIDHSGSMDVTTTDGSGITSLSLAKAAAVKALESLRKTDAIGVLAFDDQYTWVVEPQLAENTEAIQTKIGSIEIGGGTNIYPALAAAAERLNDSDAQLKHIILLTDGQDTYANYDELCSYINDAGITLSTVAVGEEANVSLLSSIAKECGGRYYYTDINSGIPRIFAKEVYLSAKEYLINEEFTPLVVSNHEIISALSDGVPSLKGYIASTAKPTATQLLVSHKNDPILTVWQYGLGHTVAWNSDATGGWTENWALWDGYVQFWKNVVDYTISDTDLDGDTLEVVQEGSSAQITYTTDDYDSNTKVSAICTDEDGNTKELVLDPVSPGTYEAKLDTDNVGVYNIAVKNQSGDEVVKSANTATAMQYSAEYRFTENTDSLSKLTAMSGGRTITMEDEVFLEIEQVTKAKYSMTNILLLLALALYMIDVIERRLNVSLLAPFIRRAPSHTVHMHKEKPAQREAKKKKTDSKPENPPKIQNPKTLDTATLLKKQQERNR